MKLLVSSSPWPLARSLPAVVEHLLDAGVELVFSTVEDNDPVPESSRGHAGVSVAELPLKREDEQVALFRALSDLVRFYDPALADAEWPRWRTALRTLDFAGHPRSRELAPRLAALRVPADVHARATQVMTDLERRMPPDPELLEAVRSLDVDAVLLVSRCSLGGAERDLLKVTEALGLPSVMLVWSWDNLSSKAVLHEHPDHLLVWNATQVDEAEQQHGIPRERVHALGAPSFDEFFEALARTPRPARDEKTVLYLGSSKNIAREEPTVFADWHGAVRGADDDVVRGARIVVRPYPGGGAWSRWKPAETDFTVERGKKLQPDGLARALAGVDAVVALNTSGELEAAIAELPVVTFRAGGLAPGQEGSLHFEYLLERNGGFVVDSADLDEHVANLARVLRGRHDLERQRAFVERFLRPCGLDRPVSPIVAGKILELLG